MCCSISIFDELFSRTAQSINQCLSSACLIISNVARHGVFFGRMMSLWVRMHFIVVTDMAFLLWKSMRLAQHLLLGL